MFSQSSLPIVAIVGRPNVGKSTLLNRIIGRREAIVEARPGVTRDRKEVDTEWNGYPFTVVDTGGWMVRGDELDDKVSRQSEKAILDADVAILVVDATVGPAEDDTRITGLLRRRGGPVLVVANKVDDGLHEGAIWDFMALGLGEPIAVSALHGRNAGELLDRVVAELEAVRGPAPAPDAVDADDPDRSPREASGDIEAGRIFAVALVGRPNVGKSTLFNRLIGEDRSVVHDLPGTTRDSIDTVVQTPDGPIRFVDTAGMRRRSKVDAGTERFSTVRALASVDTADIALLVIDATEGITHQDQRLAERVDGAGCPIVIVLNKWELLDAEGREQVTTQLGRRLAFLGDSVVLKISALTGKGVHRLLPALSDVVDAYRKRVPTRRVNEIVAAAQSAQPAPDGARVLYATQVATDPPTFTLFANRELPRTYLRYLENTLKRELGMGSTPVKLRVRRRS
ncbi:MAG: ribosome biogenesis GTPase Der [Actinobacteria bacterium]|nr:ribosome biogenesis GTPase Der [Actinomycetota bacterium]